MPKKREGFLGLGEELGEKFEKLLDARLAVQKFAVQHRIDGDFVAGTKIEGKSKLKLHAAIDGVDLDSELDYIENFVEDLNTKEKENGTGISSEN